MTTLMPELPGREGDGHEPDMNALSAFAEGRLDARERAHIVEHLAGCARCREIVGSLAPFASPRTAAVPRWSAATLSLAATLAVAVAGGGLYVATRRAPNAPPPGPAPTTTAIPLAPSTAPRQDIQPSTGDRGAQPSQEANPPADRTRAAGSRRIAGKSFHLVAGEWIDDAYDPTDLLPIVEVSTQADFDARPALRPYRSLGARITVVIDGTAYRIALPRAQR